MKLRALPQFVLALIPVSGFAFAQTQKPADATKPIEAPKTVGQNPVSYVRVKNGTSLRNLPDAKGVSVLDAAPATLLAVYRERAGWLEAEPAAGMKVWVHGMFVKRTTTPGVVEITANNVRMRPLPSSDEKSFPLPSKLDKGERLRLISRADPSKPVGEDWIQVWSPPGARAYVAAADTAAVDSNEDVRKTWTAAATSARATAPVVELGGEGTSPASGGAGAKTAAVAGAKAGTTEAAAKQSRAGYEKLEQADKLLATAKTAENPDFGPAKQAYQAVIAEGPQGDAARTAQARLDEIAIREEIQGLKAEKAKSQTDRAQKLADAEARLKEVNQRQDPLQGRFQARGWLENTATAGQPAHYVLRWSGKDVAEISCGSGRYDLAKFVGFEVGIYGVVQKAEVPAADGEPGSPAQIDASRVEVIAAHTTR
jgi:hypothetical protein